MTKESNTVAYVVKDAVYVAGRSINDSLSNILDKWFSALCLTKFPEVN